jgi:glycosyltransferase involved in cell wall biosynthesis
LTVTGGLEHATNKMSPSVTVLLPTRNNLATLKPALESVLSQGGPDIEVLVIDSGSDGTAEWLRTLADDRVVYLFEERRGLGRALNLGLEKARSPLIARMDADDIMLPGRLEAQAAFLDSHPDTAVVGTQFKFLISGETVPVTQLPLDHESIRRHLLHGSCVLCHPTVMFRADAARQAGGYRIPGMGEELDFFLRVSECGRAANLPETFLLYRLDTQSASMRALRETSIAHAYAMDCASRRARNDAESSFTEFADKWRSTAGRSFSATLDEFSRAMHRRHLLARGRKQRLRALSWLTAACVFSPKRTALHIQRLVTGHFVPRTPARHTP